MDRVIFSLNCIDEAPTFISYLVIYLSFYAFLAVWLVYKNFREKLVYTTSHHRDPYHAEQPSFISEKKEAANDQKTGEASADKFKGYSDDWFGYWMVLYCGIVSVGWMVFLLVISLDYYGYVQYSVKNFSLLLNQFTHIISAYPR